MPKIDAVPAQTPNATGAQPYGDNQNDNQITFQERLMRRFSPTEYVTVKNIDDEPFIWQYLPADQEDFEMTPDPMKITRRGEPEMWQIDPGQAETLVGANAYLMVQGLYKKIIAKTVVAKDSAKDVELRTPKHVAKNFNWNDPNTQERYISLIVVGKATPMFQTQTEPEPAATNQTATNEQPNNSTTSDKKAVGANK